MITGSIEGFAHLKLLTQNLRSGIDSFMFEISGCAITNDCVKIEYIVKRFKNHLFNNINQIVTEFGNLENEINQTDFLKQKRKQQDTIDNLYQTIVIYGDKEKNLISKHECLLEEIETLKRLSKSTKNDNVEKEIIIDDLKQKIEYLEEMVEEEKLKSNQKLLYQTDENAFLKEALNFKEKEIQNLNKEKLEINKNFNKTDKDFLVSRALLKQCEDEIKEYQMEIKKYKTLEKVDKQNLGNVKNMLASTKTEVKNQENLLKIDYELISNLKNEISNQHHQIKESSEEKEALSSELDEEKQKNSIIIEENESLQIKLVEVSDFLTNTIEKNNALKEKKRVLTKECNEYKSELLEIKRQLNENKEKINVSEKELQNLRSNLEKAQKDLTESQSKIKALSTMKTIAEEKIKLLKQFIEDFRITDIQFKNSIIFENNKNLSKIDMLQKAYERLF